MKHYLYLCGCLIWLAACNVSSADNGDVLIIPVDVKQDSPVGLSEIADNIQKIELETSDECLIRSIRQVICVDDRIFVHDGQGVGVIHVFDYSGKFLFGIDKRGQGPGEYLGILGITADPEKRHLYVGTLSKILRYDLDDGHFIDEFTKSEPGYIHFENDIIYVLREVEGRPTDQEGWFANKTVMWRYSLDWQLIDTLVMKTRIFDRITGSFPFNTDIISHDSQNNLYVYYPVMNRPPNPNLRPQNELRYEPHDTLYMLDDNRLKPYAKLKFSNDKPSQPNKSISYLFRTSNLLIAKYQNFSEEEDKLFCYDFNNKTGKNMTNGFTDDVYDTGITDIRLLNSQYFYYVKAVKDIPAYTEEPNPVLYIGKLKE